VNRILAAALMLAVIALAAPAFAPHDPDEIIDVLGARHLRPGARVLVITRSDGSRIAASHVDTAGDTLTFVRADRPGRIPLQELGEAPSPRRFVLGTDAFGRDLLSRILHGARMSIGVTLVAVGLGLVLGVGIGALAGYFGGVTDAGFMRLIDVLHAVPRIFLFLLCAALFGPSALLVGIVLGTTGWIGIARITRGHVLSLRDTGFAAAARAIGGSQRRVILRHVLPNCAAPIAVAAVLLAADTILAESALSFIGVGVQPPAASWGTLIAAGRDGLHDAWWVMVFPGLSIALTVMGLYAMARRAIPGPGRG